MSIAEINFSKSYSYADYYGWQIDERIELINGKVYMLCPCHYYKPSNTYRLYIQQTI